MEEIPAPLPLIQKKYSLEPDMIFGWKPKIPKSSPIPLDFNLNPLPSCKDNPDQKFPIIYHGYRPPNSHIMHKLFSNKSTYNYLIKSSISVDIEYNYKNAAVNSLGRYNGMKKEFTEEIEFDSFFECGNLDKVIKYSKNEYDLYMRSDTNAYGSYKWFYFQIINKAEDRVIKLNIVNFKEQHSLFTQGQKPMIKYNDEGWEQFQGSVVYKLSKLNKNVKKGTYYQLAFEVPMKRLDSCFLATTLPYTASELHQFLDGLPSKVQLGSIGRSLSGLTIPLLTITDNNSKNPKKYIIIQARTHPSETVASVLIQNCIQYLVSNEIAATKLLKRYVFKIIPMVNVDGVIAGNSRMSLAGDDLNRKFAEPDTMLHPEVLDIKGLVDRCNHENGVLMFIDIHGHSKKKGSFMYGPYFPLHSNTYFNIRLLPKYLSKKTDIFRYYSCKFKSEKSMRQSARLVMSQNLNIKYTYTMENSLYGYIDQERNSHSFKPHNFKDLAKDLIESIYKFTKYTDPRKYQKSPKGRHKNNLQDILEENEQNYSSSESDSQSESEEVCIEAKNNVVNAIRNFRKAIVRKENSTSTNKTLYSTNKKINSQNHLGANKNLPVVNKRMSSPQKYGSNIEKGIIKNSAQQIMICENKSLSIYDAKIKAEVSNSLNTEISLDKSGQRIGSVQKKNYSKVNIFEMFTNRKEKGFVRYHSGIKKNLNLPAFYPKLMRD